MAAVRMEELAPILLVLTTVSVYLGSLAWTVKQMLTSAKLATLVSMGQHAIILTVPTSVCVLQDSAVSIVIKMLTNVTKLIFAFTETALTAMVLIPASVMLAIQDQTA